MAFQLFSPAFAEGADIPVLHTGDGADISPSLEWNGEPEGARSYGLIVDDPDAPDGVWTHWLLYDIPPAVHALSQGFRPGRLGVSGTNDFGSPGYGGPCPPKGHGRHRYRFQLLALSVESLGLPAGATRPSVDQAMQGRVLARTQYMGRYGRL
ncbi:MAG TPA: YbhB/YbcL family Raf kinase inhibitor-like protein [Solibacterales bacterium]|nr:YbhB/YbcL family Raf kinase inhibitor-like protein [Bryobacterales bacterium]